MARTIAIEVPHRLGVALACDRIAAGIDELPRTLRGAAEVAGYDWPSDQEAIVEIVAMGKPVTVTIAVEAELVRIGLELPLMLSLMAGPITAKIRGAVADMLHAPVETAAPAAAVPSAPGMTLYQYWDRPAPPADVAAWIDGFRHDNPALEHVLMNRDSAASFIGRHHGPRHAAAFAACVHPAMQADYFRLCAMAATGGVYLDADMQSLRPLDGLIARAPEALIAVWKGLLNNSILVFRTPGHSFVRAALALATRIIEARRFHSVALATGPGVFNAIRYIADPAFRAQMEGMLTHGWGDVSALIGDTSDPELAVKVGSTLDRAGWDDLRALAALADELSPEFPTLAADYAAITLIGTAESMAWIGQAQAAYQAAGDSWIVGDRQLYR